MTHDEIVNELRKFTTGLYGASLDKAFSDGEPIDYSAYPPRYREYIKDFLEDDTCDSVRATFNYTLKLLGV